MSLSESGSPGVITEPCDLVWLRRSTAVGRLPPGNGRLVDSAPTRQATDQGPRTRSTRRTGESPCRHTPNAHASLRLRWEGPFGWLTKAVSSASQQFRCCHHFQTPSACADRRYRFFSPPLNRLTQRDRNSPVLSQVGAGSKFEAYRLECSCNGVPKRSTLLIKAPEVRRDKKFQPVCSMQFDNDWQSF